METKTLHKLEQFQIKSGTRALGVEYEDKITAYFSLLLAQDSTVRDFKILSNDPKYGNFDDLVVPTESFLSEKGDFGLLKYFKETEKKKIPEEVRLVLFTNRTFSKKKNEKSTIKLEAGPKTEITLKIFQINDEQSGIIKSINSYISGETYQFKVKKNEEKEDSFEKILKILYFYTCQDDVNGIQAKLRAQFLGQPTHEQFVKFVENSSKTEKKFKLNKEIIIYKFMECLLWSHSVNACKDIPGQNILFNKVFSKFYVAVFEQFLSIIQGYDNKFVDAKGTKNVIRLLWHLNELALIIKSDCPREILCKVLKSKEETFGRRLVVGKVDEEITTRRVLRNLLQEHFKDSQINLQGRKWSFVEYASNDNEFARIFCTDEIVRLLLKEETFFFGRILARPFSLH